MSRKIDIMVVDDEKQITELLETFIQCLSTNASVYSFNNSEDAKCFIEEKNNIDILITDYKMPKYDGIQLLEIAGPDVRKILISGYISEIAAERLQKLNATFFEKPVPIKALETIILDQENLINKKVATY